MPGVVLDVPGMVVALLGPMPVAPLMVFGRAMPGALGVICMVAPLLVPSAEPLPVAVDWVGLAIWVAAPELPVAGVGGADDVAPAPMV